MLFEGFIESLLTRIHSYPRTETIYRLQCVMSVPNKLWDQVEDCFNRIPSFEPEVREAILFRIAGTNQWNSPWGRLQQVASKDVFITLLRSTVQTICDTELERLTFRAIEKAIPKENENDKLAMQRLISDHFGKSAIDAGQLSVLFLAAEPTNDSALRLGKEFREIQEIIGVANRDNAALALEMPQFATRPKDLLNKVLGFRPSLVHFSGHGDQSGGLKLESQDGRSHTVQPEALADFFSQCKQYLQCVVLNACYSSEQAKEISKHIPHAIGMSDKIGNADAVKFSVGFYTALNNANTDFQAAFNAGCSMLKLENSPYVNVPGLYRSGQRIEV